MESGTHPVKKAILHPSGFTGSIHQESTTSQHAHGKTSKEYFCLSRISYMLLTFDVQLHMTGSDRRMTPSQYYEH